MRCPECARAGVLSKVYVGVSRQTLVHAAPFYDEQGRYHLHNPNRATTEYKCSNGHRWTVADAVSPRCVQGDWP